MINVNKCTIQWYVDDTKVIHASNNVIKGVIYIMKKDFVDLVMSHGRKYKFISMSIELVKDGKINIGVQICIKDEIEKLEKAYQEGSHH